MVNDSKIVIKPLYADYAFPNTMKGQRGQIGAYDPVFVPGQDDIFSRVYKMYFNWNELERTIDDSEERIIEVCEKRFSDCREHNVRFIPRIAIQWPNNGDHTKATAVNSCFPSDMVHSTLDTPEFHFRIRNLVEKLGRVWNKDPRIAYIEMGIYGLWGEQHEDSLSRLAQKNLSDAFHNAFPDKLCMLRCPRDCMGEGFGMYWDSFAHIDEEFYAADAVRFLDWRKAVMGGEVAHNWGHHEIQPGENMNDTLINPIHRDHFFEYVYWQHNNHLGMWLVHDDTYEKALEGLCEYQKRAGYRFVLEQVAYEIRDGRIHVAFDVKNVGASPFYYNWPVSAALLADNGLPICEYDFDTDIRSWMPGDKWNFDKHEYDEPARTYSVSGIFPVENLPSGVYKLALAIKDPSCGKPNVMFATRQYKNGGWHPIGLVGINTKITNPIIIDSFFDDQREDHTITY